MTWSAFALFLARGTEFAFNIGHFLIILPFHSVLATFQVYISLIFDPFWMKPIQGNVYEYVHKWYEFLFVTLLLIFNSFPQINHFYYLSLYMACKMWKIAPLTWEISSERLVEKSAFPMYYSVYNWIREHEITKLKKRYLLRMQKKDTKTSTKRHGWNEMKWHKMDYLTFSEMRMRKRHLFCTSSHHNLLSIK